jgi:hypothetical protein
VKQLNEVLPQIFTHGGVQKEFGQLFQEGTVAFILGMDVTVSLNVFTDGSYALEIASPGYEDNTPESVEKPSLEEIVPSAQIPVKFSILGNRQGVTKAFVQFGAVKKYVDNHGQANIDTTYSRKVPLPLEITAALIKWVETS